MKPIAAWIKSWAWLLIGVLIAGVLGWLLYTVPRMADQIEVLDRALTDEQANAQANGIEPVAPDAEELIEDPEYSPSDAPPEPVGPTDAQVLDAVEDYFAEHPVQDGENASPAQIAAAVINYLTDNPPAPGEPGPAPTADQISNAVAVYLAENPPPAGDPGKDGTDGTDGKDADPLTSEEIQAQLDAYLEANPLPMCPPGTAAEARTLLAADTLPVEVVVCVVQ